jgi:Flp pilus assembly protein TadD
VSDSPDRHPRLESLIVVLAAVTAFLPGVFGDFVGWDDDRNFTENEAWRGLGWPHVRWMFTAWHMGHYIPVTWLTLGFDYVVWGLNPRGFHLTSLVLHAATALAVLAVARRLLPLALPAVTSEEALRLGALGAALLFAVHPLRVESVVWITERRDVVSGVLALLVVLAYLTAVERSRPSGALHPGWYAAALALFGLALLAKSIVVTLPLMLVVLDVFPLRRLGGGSQTRVPRLVLEKIPFLLLSAVATGITLAAGRAVGNAVPLDALGLSDRLTIALYGLSFYLGRTLAPFGLSPLYGMSELETLSGRVHVVAGVLLVAAFAVAAVRRRLPAALAAAAAVYVLGLLPVLGLVQSGPQLVADRYSYIACLGWAVLAGGIVARVFDEGRAGAARVARRPAALVMSGAALVVSLVALSARQSLVWHDSETLWRHAVRLGPGNAEAHTNLGATLIRAGRPEEAREPFERAVSLNRGVPEALVGLAVVRSLAGRADEAVTLAAEAVARRPGEPRFHLVLAAMLRRAGDLERALQTLRGAAHLIARPEIHYEIALTLSALNRNTEAVAALEAGRTLARHRGGEDREGERYAAQVYTGFDPERAVQAWERYLEAMTAVRHPTVLDEARIANAQQALERLRTARPAS